MSNTTNLTINTHMQNS